MKIKDGVLISIDKRRDIKRGTCIIPDRVKSINKFAFFCCKELTSIVISDSVTNIGRDAFEGCSKLTNVIIGNGVISIDKYAFANCSNLTSVTIGNNVKSIGCSAFYYCSALSSIVIPDSVTCIDDSAFYGCSKVTSPVLSGSTIKAVKGFYKDKGKLVCRGFVYELGKTYEEPEAKLCKKGFHACMCGLDVFSYYAGENVAYYEVELSGISPDRRDDSKICGTTITLLKELTVAEAANYRSEIVK